MAERPGHKHLPIGSERPQRRGGHLYLMRKVSDTGVQNKDWIGVHVLTWEAEHGPIPPGHVVTFYNGDRSDTALDNLECITRAEQIQRSSWSNYPKELHAVFRLKAALTRKINAHDN